MHCNCLFIDVGDATRNKAIFDSLNGKRDEIEQKTGTLEWERLDQRRASRISLVRPNTTIDDTVTRAEEIRVWIVQALLKMRAVFGPLLNTVV